MDYKQLYQILVEAEQRRDDARYPQAVRDRSSETVALVEQRMQMEGLTRAQLKRGY